MQFFPDLTIASNLVTIALSTIMAMYLISIWYKQERRLNTDLPLMFGITFVAQAVNNLIRILPTLGLVEASMMLFRIRSMVIIATAFPLLGVVLHIWLPRFRKQHMRILTLLVLYWTLVAMFAPTEESIILLVMPIILTLTIGMIVTFLITWKTGRLKEIRSDLVVLSFIFGIASQVVATQIILNNTLTALATVVSTLGLTNPWRKESTPSPEIQNVSVESMQPSSTYQS